MLALALAGLLLGLGAREEEPYAAVALLTVCEALVMSVEGAYWASATEVARGHAGAAGGVLNTGGNVGGALSPWLTPAVAAVLGWVAALDVAAGLSVVGGLLWLGVSPTPRPPDAAPPSAEDSGPHPNDPPTP